MAMLARIKRRGQSRDRDYGSPSFQSFTEVPGSLVGSVPVRFDTADREKRSARFRAAKLKCLDAPEPTHEFLEVLLIIEEPAVEGIAEINDTAEPTGGGAVN